MKIIAHRGFWNTNNPIAENSIEALKNAQELEIYGSECDVQMTKDGILIINHDDLHGEMNISETCFEELRKLKLSNGEIIPSLEEYLQQAKKHSTLKIIIELKPENTENLEREKVQQTLKLVADLSLENQVEYISFSLNICMFLKSQKRNTIVLYLNGDLSPEHLKEIGLDGLDYEYDVLIHTHPEWIQEAKKLGLITNAWTVNNSAIFETLSQKGIDYITTDIPKDYL